MIPLNDIALAAIGLSIFINSLILCSVIKSIDKRLLALEIKKE